jgi:hypothetical protein
MKSLKSERLECLATQGQLHCLDFHGRNRMIQLVERLMAAGWTAQGFTVPLLAGARDFTFVQNIQSGSRAHPAFQLKERKGHLGLFLWG